MTTINPVTSSPTRPQRKRCEASDRGAARRADGPPADGERGRGGKARDRQDSGGDQAFVQRPHDRIARPELDKVSSGDGRDDARRADRQRIEHGGIKHRLAGEENRGEHHGGDDRHRVGFEQISGHSGAIADIVADIIGDRRRIAGIVLGNAGFDLADEIGADIGALGENAAAETGEDRNQRCAETERDQRVDRLAALRRMAERPGENIKIRRDAEECEARDQEPGDGARLERNVEARGERLHGRLGGAHIGANRDIHADKARGAGKDRADQKSGREQPGNQEAKGGENGNADNGDRRILAFQIGLRALRDGPGDFLHLGRTGIGGEEFRRRHHAIDDR